jgi:hypothetical protein
MDMTAWSPDVGQMAVAQLTSARRECQRGRTRSGPATKTVATDRAAVRKFGGGTEQRDMRPTAGPGSLHRRARLDGAR